MRRALIAITLAGAVASIFTPARGQAPAPSAPPQWHWPQEAYVGAYQQPAPSLNAPTPWDAYKQGLINRWELERLEGPTPQALQGPAQMAETRAVVIETISGAAQRRRVQANDARVSPCPAFGALLAACVPAS